MPSEKQQRNVQSVCTHMSPGDSNNCTAESRDPPQKMITTQTFNNSGNQELVNVFKKSAVFCPNQDDSTSYLDILFFLKIWTIILPLALSIKPTL